MIITVPAIPKHCFTKDEAEQAVTPYVMRQLIARGIKPVVTANKVTAYDAVELVNFYNDYKNEMRRK